MRGGKNFRRWFRSKRPADGLGQAWDMLRSNREAKITFGTGAKVEMSDSDIEYIRSFTSVGTNASLKGVSEYFKQNINEP